MPKGFPKSGKSKSPWRNFTFPKKADKGDDDFNAVIHRERRKKWKRPKKKPLVK